MKEGISFQIVQFISSILENYRIALTNGKTIIIDPTDPLLDTFTIIPGDFYREATSTRTIRLLFC